MNLGHYWIFQMNPLTFLDYNFEMCLLRPWLHLIKRQSITSRFPCYGTKAKSSNDDDFFFELISLSQVLLQNERQNVNK